MNSYQPILLVVSMLFFTLACDTDNTTPSSKTNCPFVVNNNDDGLIDQNERALMEDCLANAMVTKAEIENHIIGNWELIGHGEGWWPSVSMPCSRIKISSTELILEFANAQIDTTTVHNWQVVPQTATSKAYLDIIPPLFSRIHLPNVCQNYMFGDATPADGNMYLYQKCK